LAAATFGAEFTGPEPDEPLDPEVELEPPPVLPLRVSGVELPPEEEAPEVEAAGLDSPPSDFALLEE
jgi:hypothetical protein